MSLQIRLQSQWDKSYGRTLSIFSLAAWFWGFQLVIMNFRLYVGFVEGDY